MIRSHVAVGCAWAVTLAAWFVWLSPLVGARRIPVASRRVQPQVAQQVLHALAVREPFAWEQARRNFPDAWSQGDDRAHMERDYIRSIAAQHHLTLSETYLILDEGIRTHWQHDGAFPFTTRVAPLKPRQQ
jgi:hypothetical protein